jgi:hypothetical protein
MKPVRRKPMNVDNPDQAPQNRPVLVDLHHLSPDDLGRLGVSQLAYIKPVMVEGGGTAFAIHAADGTPMALAGDIQLAAAAILQHDMVPALVH